MFFAAYVMSVKRGRHPTTTQTSDITRSFWKTQPRGPAEFTSMSPKDAMADGAPPLCVSMGLHRAAVN